MFDANDRIRTASTTRFSGFAALAATASLAVASATFASTDAGVDAGDSTGTSASIRQHELEKAGAGDSLRETRAKRLPDLEAFAEARTSAEDPTGSLAAQDKETIHRILGRHGGSDIVIPPDAATTQPAKEKHASANGLDDGSELEQLPIVSCTADMDFDGVVDWWDLVLVLADYGRDDTQPDKQAPAANGTGAIQQEAGVRAIYLEDPTRDGRWDFDDVIAVLAAWGDCG